MNVKNKSRVIRLLFFFIIFMRLFLITYQSPSSANQMSVYRLCCISILLCSFFAFVSCKKESVKPSAEEPILEVAGKFLYKDELQKIIPPNVSDSDSISITQSYIRKWVVDVLMYENAKRNISNKDEIDALVENYRKSLIIHEYQQKLIQQKLPSQPDETEVKAFYEQYSDQFHSGENIIKGLLLVVPAKAPQLGMVRSWVQSGNTSSLEKIEKYSLRNAVSYDYSADKWIPFSDVLKRLPLQISDPAGFLRTHKFIEVTDSAQHYFLRIEAYRTSGQQQPYELAKDRISTILQNKQKADFISTFENDLYNDAVKDETVTFFYKK